MITFIEPIASCPQCRGTGVDYSIIHHALVGCALCWGRGYVPSVRCKSCGRPATKFWPPKQRPIIRYCGLESCLNNLVKLHKQPPTVGGYRPVPVICQVVRNITEASSQERRDQMEELKSRLAHRGIGPGAFMLGDGSIYDPDGAWE